MSIQALWWSILVATLGLLLYNVTVYWRHRRRATPLPTYAAGNVTSGFGFLLLILSQLLDMKGALAHTALAGSLVLVGLSIALGIIAQRRVKRVMR